jgi:MFS family permease
MILLGIFTM